MALPLFQHTPLPGSDRESFRLFRLLPAGSSGAKSLLTGEIFTTTLSKCPRYEAISYCWGSDASGSATLLVKTKTQPILGRNRGEKHAAPPPTLSALSITPSCAAVLAALRRPARARLLWIDGVCIDQTSRADKARQVPIMGTVYRRARGGVVIWLGAETPGSERDMFRLRAFLALERARLPAAALRVAARAAFELALRFSDDNPEPEVRARFEDLTTYNDLMSTLAVKLRFGIREARSAKSERNGLEAETTGFEEAVREILDACKHLDASFSPESDGILSREWFTRVWVIQEAALGTKGGVPVSLLAGRRRCPWADFRRFVLLADTGARYSRKDLFTTTSMPALRLRIHGILAEQCEKGSKEKGLQDVGSSDHASLDLSDILLLTHYQAASEPRDKVYALYGVLRELGLSTLPTPDYERPVSEVYRDVCKAVMCHDRSIKLLGAVCGWGSLGDRGGYGSSGGGYPPSWVPDFSTSDLPFPVWAALRKENKGWQASGTSSATFEFIEVDRHPDSRGAGHHLLKVRGMVVDRIKICSDETAGEPSNEENADGDKVDTGFARRLARWAVMVKDVDTYPTGEVIANAFTGAVCRQVNEDGHSSRTSLVRHMTAVLQSVAELRQPLAQCSPQSEFYRNMQRQVQEGDDKLIRVEELSRLQAFFLTDKGYMGLGPINMKQGDQVCLLSGLQIPLVMRENAPLHHLIGPAHVYGMMEGQLWRDEGLQMFEIV